jgi:hypothetical protein
MMKRGDILIGIGAGLVSALLFATVIRGSLLAILLFYLTPLPIAIVSLGWQHRSGIAATMAGALAIALIFDPELGLLFALTFALPVWWLSFLTLLARDNARGAALSLDSAAKAPAEKQWYPLGSLGLWAGGLSVILTLAGALMLGPSYEAYRASIQDVLQGVLISGLAELPSLTANPEQLKRFASIVASIVVPASAAASTLLTLLILLVAAKLVSLSGRLPRPLPAISRDFVLPRITLLGLAASVVLSPFGGWPRFIALAIVGTLAILLAMQGLATAHILLARVPARPIILGVGYALIVVGEPWMLLGLAVLGLIDMVLSLRTRSLAAAASRGKPY